MCVFNQQIHLNYPMLTYSEFHLVILACHAIVVKQFELLFGAPVRNKLFAAREKHREMVLAANHPDWKAGCLQVCAHLREKKLVFENSGMFTHFVWLCLLGRMN